MLAPHRWIGANAEADACSKSVHNNIQRSYERINERYYCLRCVGLCSLHDCLHC